MKYRTHLCCILIVLSGCGVHAAERNNAGNSSYEQGMYDEAIKAYQAAQVVAPDSAVFYVNAASVYAQAGRLDDAQTALRQALKTADEILAAQAYYNLGNIYFEMQLYADAVASYQQTLLLTPGDQDARYNLELALSQITPPPDAQTSEFQEQLHTLATPTTQAVGESTMAVTPTIELSTPSPQVDPQEAQAQTSTPASNLSGTMTREDAEQLLNAVQQDAITLSGRLQQSPVPGSTPQRDW